MTELAQAIAEGQFEFPRGLFFGGNRLEQGPALYLEWLRNNLSGAEYLFAIDLHTGLGRRGQETLFLEPEGGATPLAALGRAFDRRFIDPAAKRAPYRIRGSMGKALLQSLPDVRIDFVLQEIGTRHPLVVLHALREENRFHHYGPVAATHAARRALRDALSPPSPGWRRQALERGLALLRDAAAWTFQKALAQRLVGL